MRCQTLRSAFRTVLAAGLIASCQNAMLFASWKDCLPPVGGSCFVHDLQWDQFRSPSCALYSSRSNATSEPEIASAATAETDLCIVAAKQFELRMHVDAVMSSAGTWTRQFANVGANLLVQFSRSRHSLASAVESQALTLVEWFKTPDLLPVTIVDSGAEDDIKCDWNCGRWDRVVESFTSNRMPLRSGGNIFVFALPIDSSSPESDICSEEIAMAANFEFARSVTQTWQVGVDPVCPEVMESNLACRWSDYFAQPSICCPIDLATVENTTEAIAMQAVALPATVAAIRPPTLEAESEVPLAKQQWQSSFVPNVVFDNSDEPTLETAQKFSPWSFKTGRRFAFGDNAPRMPEIGPPIVAYTMEDLQSASRLPARFIDELPSYPNPAERNFNDLIVPYLSYLHRVAVDFTMKSLTNPVTESRIRMSKSLATPIRTLGQFLVDFASKIESQMDQVEIARRDLNQR